MSFVVLQRHTLLVAIFTDEAEFTSALFVVPRVASLRPNVDTLLVAGAVVRLSGTPLVVVHEAEGPQLARFRRNVLPGSASWECTSSSPRCARLRCSPASDVQPSISRLRSPISSCSREIRCLKSKRQTLLQDKSTPSSQGCSPKKEVGNAGNKT